MLRYHQQHYFDDVLQYPLPEDDSLRVSDKGIASKLSGQITFKNVVFNKTAIYTKYADLVVAHDSISINFPILFNKPILLLQMPGFELTNFKDNLDLMGKVLGCKVIDIKKYRKKELNKFYQVDQQKYKKYIQQFIKFRGENKNSWEIISKKLLKI